MYSSFMCLTFFVNSSGNFPSGASLSMSSFFSPATFSLSFFFAVFLEAIFTELCYVFLANVLP